MWLFFLKNWEGEGLRKYTWLGESRQENRLYLKFPVLIELGGYEGKFLKIDRGQEFKLS